ncbi:MAG TPA: YciI family protein [Acidobacteriota bacterium]|nr:YciI family protein [Acidobacteriota bacterium]
MRFICLGYADLTKWESMREDERQAFMEKCFAYDDELRRAGHFVGGEALQGTENAVTLRMRDGRIDVTDGPYAETKEQIGGLLFLEARDLNHAIALMSKHPGVGFGPFEIRPANEEINKLLAERDEAVGKSRS